MMKNTWFVLMVVALVVPQLGWSAARSSSSAARSQNKTPVSISATTSIKDIVVNKFSAFFRNNAGNYWNSPTGQPGGKKGFDFTPPPPIKAAAPDECEEDKEVGYDNPCYQDVHCTPLGPDYYCKVPQQSYDNGSFEGCCAKKDGGLCPNGQPPVGGSCPDDDPGTPDTPPPLPPPPNSDAGVGCIGLKLTHLTDNIVKIEYGNFCPYKIDPAALISPLTQLSSGTPAKVVLPEMNDPEDPAAFEWYELPDALVGTSCVTHPDQCHGFQEYRDAASEKESKVWTANQDFKFDEYTFWKIDNLPMNQNEKPGCVLPEGLNSEGMAFNPFSKGPDGEDSLIQDTCWDTLGYARFKEFYDESQDTNGKPTHAFIPRSWLVIHITDHPPEVLYDVKGKFGHDVNGELVDGALPPTIEVGISPAPVKSGALSDNQPYWNVAATIHGGTFKMEEKEYLSFTNPTGDNFISCPKQENESVEGYQSTLSFSCNLTKMINIFGEATGLNRFDHLLEIAWVDLSTPEVTFLHGKCVGFKDEDGNGTKEKFGPSDCGNSASGGEISAKDAFNSAEDEFSSMGAGVGSATDLPGLVHLEYRTEGRFAKLHSENNKLPGATGAGSLTVTPDSTITVPWVGKLEVTPSGNNCGQGTTNVTILEAGQIKGTTLPENNELEKPTILDTTLSGDVSLVRDYNCFKYDLAVYDLDGDKIDLDIPTLEVGYQTEFSVTLDNQQCNSHIEHHEGNCDEWYITCTAVCLAASWWDFGAQCAVCWLTSLACIEDSDETVFDGLDYTLKFETKHIQKVTPSCYSEEPTEGNWFTGTEANGSAPQSSSPAMPGYQTNTVFFQTVEMQPMTNEASCSFELTHYDGTTSEETLPDMPTCQ